MINCVRRTLLIHAFSHLLSFLSSTGAMLLVALNCLCIPDLLNCLLFETYANVQE